MAASYAEQIRQAQVGSVRGETVEVSQSAVRNVVAGEATVRQAIVDRMSAERVDVSQSGVLAARVQGHLAVQDSVSGALVAQSISVENSRTLFLLSPNVSGSVTAAFTLPAAFALGFGYVVGRSLMGLLAGPRR